MNLPPSPSSRDSENTFRRSCILCNKTFTNEANFRVHARVHTKERPYHCQHCSKRFTHVTSLRTPLRTHAKAEPCSCSACTRVNSARRTIRRIPLFKSGKEDRPQTIKVDKYTVLPIVASTYGIPLDLTINRSGDVPSQTSPKCEEVAQHSQAPSTGIPHGEPNNQHDLGSKDEIPVYVSMNQPCPGSSAVILKDERMSQHEPSVEIPLDMPMNQHYPGPLEGIPVGVSRNQHYPGSSVNTARSYACSSTHGSIWSNSVQDHQVGTKPLAVNHRAGTQESYLPSPVGIHGKILTPSSPGISARFTTSTYTKSTPRAPRTSCMGQASSLADMILSMRQTSHLPQQTSSIASNILQEYVDSISPSESRNRNVTSVTYSPETELPLVPNNDRLVGVPVRNQQPSADKKVRTREKIYLCPICPCAFSRFSNWLNHYRLHSGNKPYICNVCGRGFIQSSDMTAHRRLHTKEKPYVCDTCGENFALAGNLFRHWFTHSAVDL